MDVQHRPVTSADESVKDLLSEATKEFSELVRKEVELAKTEVKEQATRAGKAVALFAGMGLLGFMSFLLVSFAAAWGLAEGIPTGLAFLAVGLLYGAIGGLLFVRGASASRRSSLRRRPCGPSRRTSRWSRAPCPPAPAPPVGPPEAPVRRPATGAGGDASGRRGCGGA